MASQPPSGSAPAHLRNAFIELIENEMQGESACQVAAQLMSCTDRLPFEYCDMLDLPPGSTFAQAAAQVRVSLGCAS